MLPIQKQQDGSVPHVLDAKIVSEDLLLGGQSHIGNLLNWRHDCNHISQAAHGTEWNTSDFSLD